MPSVSNALPSTAERRRRGGRLALPAALALAGLASACLDRPAPEPEGMARLALVPTYTALAPATATLTPVPSGTPTAPYATPTPDEFEAAGLPVRLEIPAIGVDAPVEHVGRMPNNQIDVPKLPADVAWFDESALPGQSGKTSIIVGHLDSPAGPAVFWDLRRLVPGDELTVTYANGARYVFTVEDKERYYSEQLPRDKLLGRSARRVLNLITCDGAWDRGVASYSQRLAVYTAYKGRLAAGVLSPTAVSP
jgi:sortase (surface protein transpeptidase)